MFLKNILGRPKPASPANRDPRQQAVIDRQQSLDRKLDRAYQEQRRLVGAQNVNPDPLRSALESRRSLNELRIDKLRSERSKFTTSSQPDLTKK